MSFWKFTVQVLLILPECWAFFKENKKSDGNNKTRRISPYTVKQCTSKHLKGAYNAEGLCFYLVSYTLFTGALCSHGVCMVLLCCSGKAERVDVLMPWLPAAQQQEAPSNVSRESWSSPGLRASWSPAMPDVASCDSRRTSTCLFRWELGAGASWSL